MQEHDFHPNYATMMGFEGERDSSKSDAPIQALDFAMNSVPTAHRAQAGVTVQTSRERQNRRARAAGAEVGLHRLENVRSVYLCSLYMFIRLCTRASGKFQIMKMLMHVMDQKEQS